MPKLKRKDEPPFVKLFSEFVDVNGSSNGQAHAECPFCGGPKFSFNTETGLWDCKHANRCGLRGNADTFINLIYERYLNDTTDDDLRPLGKLRQWPLQTIKRHGIAFDRSRKAWLLPYKSPEGKVKNFLRYDGKQKLNLPALAVESVIYHAHTQYHFRTVGFDPYQAALLSQRLSLRGVPMEEVTFSGANLNLMASTLLDVFRSRRITIPNHPALIADLSKLQIEEKSYGHRLSAVSDESGHADLATALAIALPIAVEEAGKKVVRAGALLVDDPNKPEDWRTIADRLEQRAAAMNKAAGWNTDGASQENFAKALNHLHATDPFFLNLRRNGR